MSTTHSPPIPLQIPFPLPTHPLPLSKTVFEIVLVFEWPNDTSPSPNHTYLDLCPDTQGLKEEQKTLIWGGIVFSIVVGLLVTTGVLVTSYLVRRSRERTEYVESELYRLDRQGRRVESPVFE